MGNSKASAFIYLILLVALFVALYYVVGGDFRVWQHWGNSTGGSVIDGILKSVGSVGDSISRSFSNFFH